MSTPKDLDTITDVVLRYRPPEKAKATKKHARSGGANVLQRKANYTHVYNSLILHWIRGELNSKPS